jgi:hypothetical protein
MPARGYQSEEKQYEKRQQGAPTARLRCYIRRLSTPGMHWCPPETTRHGRSEDFMWPTTPCYSLRDLIEGGAHLRFPRSKLPEVAWMKALVLASMNMTRYDVVFCAGLPTGPVEPTLCPGGIASETTQASAAIAGTRWVSLKSASTAWRTAVMPGNDRKAVRSAALLLTAAELVGTCSRIPASARSLTISDPSAGPAGVVAVGCVAASLHPTQAGWLQALTRTARTPAQIGTARYFMTFRR